MTKKFILALFIFTLTKGFCQQQDNDIQLSFYKDSVVLKQNGVRMADNSDTNPILVSLGSQTNRRINVDRADDNPFFLEFSKKSVSGYVPIYTKKLQIAGRANILALVKYDTIELKKPLLKDTSISNTIGQFDGILRIRVFKSGYERNWFLKISKGEKSNKDKYIPSGFALKDAVTLAWYTKNKAYSGDEKLFGILEYYSEGKQFDSLQRYLDYFSNKPVQNLFLSQTIREIKDQSGNLSNPANTQSTEETSLKNLVNNSITSIGNLDVTNIADGLAKFLVKRTKEELSVTFFEKFQEEINSDEFKDVRTLFPATASVLNVIGQEIYNYNIYINALREAFERDLDNLLLNLPKVIEDEKYQPFFEKRPEVKALCLSAIYIADGLKNKIHPGKIIEDYPLEYLDPLNKKDITDRVKLGQALSFSLRAQKNDNYWVDADTLDMLKDPVIFETYLGLLYQKTYPLVIISNTEATKDTTFGQIINWAYDQQPRINQVQNYITGLRKQVKIVGDDIKNVLQADKNTINFQDYYNYYNSTLDLVDYLGQLYKLPGLEVLKPGAKYDTYMNIARSGGSLALDINKRNYSAAVLDVFTIYKYAFGGSNDDNQKMQKDLDKQIAADDKLIEDLTAKDAKGNKATIAGLQKKHNDLVDKKADLMSLKTAKASLGSIFNDRTSDLILKYGSFMAAVVQAQNSDDVEAAIEAIALPPGSARIKRESRSNIALNAYLGLYTGYEQINGVDRCWTKNWQKINSWGLTAPVGVSFSWGICHHQSISLFISVLDIGALASFRFQDTATAQIPTVQLKDIFSPGAFISYGFPKCPISVNLGAQAGPNLRKVNVTGGSSTNPYNDYENRAYVRFSLSVVVDLPLLNLRTKSK